MDQITINVALFLWLFCLTVITIIQCNQTYVCPVTKKKDFKKNMYKHTFFSHSLEGGCSHSAWYTKKGYEKRFNCKIKKCEISSTNWRAYPNPKPRPKRKK